MEPKKKRLARARKLVAAIEAGDRATERELVGELGNDELAELKRELPRIVGELRQALCSVHVTETLTRLARTELPDAQLGLTQVIEMTEDAAHRTLAAVEKAGPLIEQLIHEAEEWRGARKRPRRPSGAKREQLPARVLDNAERLKACLSEVLIAQSFQDLTGQIIRRVAGLVAELESLVGGEGDSPTPPKPRAANAGHGPALAGTPGVVQGQGDVDDLLQELGV